MIKIWIVWGSTFTMVLIQLALFVWILSGNSGNKQIYCLIPLVIIPLLVIANIVRLRNVNKAKTVKKEIEEFFESLNKEDE